MPKKPSQPSRRITHHYGTRGATLQKEALRLRALYDGVNNTTTVNSSHHPAFNTATRTYVIKPNETLHAPAGIYIKLVIHFSEGSRFRMTGSIRALDVHIVLHGTTNPIFEIDPSVGQAHKLGRIITVTWYPVPSIHDTSVDGSGTPITKPTDPVILDPKVFRGAVQIRSNIRVEPPRLDVTLIEKKQD